MWTHCIGLHNDDDDDEEDGEEVDVDALIGSDSEFEASTTRTCALGAAPATATKFCVLWDFAESSPKLPLFGPYKSRAHPDIGRCLAKWHKNARTMVPSPPQSKEANLVDK